jgi:DNA-binding NarL/FixJ family response regulator
MDGSAVRVLVVDDQAPFRLAAKAVLGATPGFSLAGEARSGEEAVTLASELEPDLVLMDINMEGISGIEAVRRITEARPETLAILLSTYRAEDLPAEAHACGAAGYVHKEDFGPQVLQSLWREQGDPAWQRG